MDRRLGSSGLTMKQHVGGGVRRRRLALRGVTISVLWLVPQFALVGLAEAFGVIGEIDFFYTELPTSMASFSMSLLYTNAAIAASALMTKVEDNCGRVVFVKKIS